MFTTRHYKFQLKNTSLIQMKFYCSIVNNNIGMKDKGFFEVSPPYGEIEAGLTEDITVRF
jgi:hypothetical protein